MKGCIFLIILTTILGWSLLYIVNKNRELKNNTLFEKSIEKEKPLEKYAFENLAKAKIPKGKIKIKDKLEEKEKFDSYLFEFEFNPNLDNKTLKKTTGLINLPKGKSTYPLVIMIRGYVDPKSYQTGTGSKKLSFFLSDNGFVTIAPDFLGYAGSDKEAENIFESRFQTYTTILSLIKSANDIEKWNKKNIFIWGHSNGGQIALSVLEILQEKIPTVLWAPVSKPFPYSILYYTDDSEDHGKFIRKELSKFEETYDVDKYSLTNYLEKINAPILLVQGTKDDAVPEKWSKELYKKLQSLDKNVKYIVYERADHNLRPSWNEAARETLIFFLKNLTEK